MAQPVFFNKIDDESVKELVDYLSTHSASITLKIQKNYVRSQTKPKDSAGLFIDRVSYSDVKNESVFCNLSINDNQFYFQTKMNSDSNSCQLELPKKIYQLFRRNNFRVSMPVGHKYECKILYINDRKITVPIELRDLSLGGCQLSIASGLAEIKKDDLMDFYLKIEKFEFSKLTITVRHVQPVKENNTILIGASFKDLEAEITSELQAMLMHLDRVHRKRIFD